MQLAPTKCQLFVIIASSESWSSAGKIVSDKGALLWKAWLDGCSVLFSKGQDRSAVSQVREGHPAGWQLLGQEITVPGEVATLQRPRDPRPQCVLEDRYYASFVIQRH